MPINFFRRSKKEKEKASKDKVEPNEGASYNAGMPAKQTYFLSPFKEIRKIFQKAYATEA